MVDSFISTSDMGNVLVEFIGSDEYKRILGAIQDNKESAFSTGFAVAVSVMLARCPKYLGRRYSEEDPESIEALQELKEQIHKEKQKPD